MASVDIEIAGRRYVVACRDGEEPHLREVGAIVDKKAQDALGAVGSLSETKQLLFASLLLADELKEARQASSGPTAAEPDSGIAEALERLAAQVESLAERLEGSPSNP